MRISDWSSDVCSSDLSTVVAAIGLGSTAYAIYKREPAVLTTALGYFSLMELLQAVSYSVVDQCGTPLNETMTFLGYLHITFQPFFINEIGRASCRERVCQYV